MNKKNLLISFYYYTVYLYLDVKKLYFYMEKKFILRKIKNFNHKILLIFQKF